MAATTLYVARSVSVTIGKRGDQLGLIVIEPNGHCQTRAVLERKIAAQLVAYMVGQLGMGDTGSAPIYHGEEGMLTLLLTSHEEADEVRRILDDAAAAAKEIAPVPPRRSV